MRAVGREDDYMLLSGIQHFAFCRRQWALMYIESAWGDNELTMSGKLMHENAHDPLFTEKRGDRIVTRDMPVLSRRMKVRGKCDVVEFHRDDAAGVSLYGRKGKWLPVPVEYKRGSPKITDADRLQLCAQAMCLEEMLLAPVIEDAFIYYGEIRRREPVSLSAELRAKVKALFRDIHDAYAERTTPLVKRSKACNSCSLKDVCLPKLPQSSGSVRAYISKHLEDLCESC